MAPTLTDLPATGLLAAAGEALRARRLAEVAELRLAVQWAVLSGEPRDERDPMVSPGGDGTPDVREYAIPELAMARETHPATTRALIADGLDLAHRLPLTWGVVVAGECEAWVARRVAVISRALPLDRVGIVDRAVAKAIAGHAASTVLQIAQAKVIEADPDTHRAERERARHERYVTLSRCDEYGYRTIIAKVTAGDAAWIDAMVDHVADILGEEHGHDHNHDELRSMSLALMARPADLLKLLLEHAARVQADGSVDTEPVEPTEPEESATAAGVDKPDERPVWAPDHLADTLGRLADLSVKQLAALRGQARLFVHVADEALRTGTGVARVEGVGPVDVAQLHELLGHADVVVTPVLDLAQRRRADAYEHPEVVKDHVWTQTGGDCSPYAPRTATRAIVDFDHSVPYDPNGPPGQTGPHNSGPLRRRSHRWKTHGGYTCQVAGPGRHVWQTPHGLAYLVDHTGTRRLTNQQADIILTAPDGVEIYFAPLELVRPAYPRAPDLSA